MKKIAAHIADFCDIKNFTSRRDASCPIPRGNVVDVDENDEEKLKELKSQIERSKDAWKVIRAIQSVAGSKKDEEDKGDLAEYGFTVPSIYSIILTINSLPESELKTELVKEVNEFKESEPLDEDSLDDWESFFRSIREYLEANFKSITLSPDTEKEYASVNHKDSLDSYKNEVSGCIEKGKCCALCEHLVDCPVPEYICLRVQRFALKTRQEISESEERSMEEIPGFDPANLHYTREPAVTQSAISTRRQKLISEALKKKKELNPDVKKVELTAEEIKEIDKQVQEYAGRAESLKQRKEKEQKEEKNPFTAVTQREQELEREEQYPGITVRDKAWDRFLDELGKKPGQENEVYLKKFVDSTKGGVLIPQLDSEKNPVLDSQGNQKYIKLVLNDENIRASDLKTLLTDPRIVEEYKKVEPEYIEKIKETMKGRNLGKGLTMTIPEHGESSAKEPQLGGLHDVFEDVYKDQSVGVPKEKPGAHE